jgi:rhomboid family GlyGly-CTERM serine protease
MATTLANHGGLRLPWFTLSVTALLLLLFGFAGPAPEALIYDRMAIMSGEFWRLFTGHFVHTDNNHLTWNVLAFLILGAVLEWEFRLPAHFHFTVLGLGALTIDAWLWWGMPEITRYCGISAVLNTQLGVAAILLWATTKSPLAILVGLGAMAKIVAEITLQTSLFTDTLWPSVPEAHLAGLVIGLLSILIIKAKYERGAPRPTTADSESRQKPQ